MKDSKKIELNDAVLGDVTQRAPRTKAVELQFRVRWDGQSDWIIALAVNISGSGVLLRLPSNKATNRADRPMYKPPHLGLQLAMQVADSAVDNVVDSKSGKRLSASSKVVRILDTEEGPALGLQFETLSRGLQKLIGRMVHDEFSFANYRLEALLGTGGMAEVYRATVTAGPNEGRTIAIKRMRAEFAADKLFVELLKLESNVAALMKHPNIIEVLDVGATGDVQYIAMEYVPGFTLRDLLSAAEIKNIALPIDLICYVGRQTALALDYVHNVSSPSGTGPNGAMGIVHRDVAPSNILMTNNGIVKLADFGVVHVASWVSPDQTRAIAGRAAYVAPEQLERAAVTGATDLFALGAVLYELLSGEQPFAGHDAATIWKNTIEGLKHGPKYLREDIPLALDQVIYRSLATRRAPSKESSWWNNRVHDFKLAFGFSRPTRYASCAILADKLSPFIDPGTDYPQKMADLARTLKLGHYK